MTASIVSVLVGDLYSHNLKSCYMKMAYDRNRALWLHHWSDVTCAP